MRLPATDSKVVEAEIRNVPELSGAFVSVARQANSQRRRPSMERTKVGVQQVVRQSFVVKLQRSDSNRLMRKTMFGMRNGGAEGTTCKIDQT